MNKDKLNIMRFLDGDMSDSEKKIFETELNSNATLKREFERVKNTLTFFEPSSLNLDSLYYQTILPRFHQSRSEDKKESFLVRRFAMNLIPAVVILIITYIGFENYSAPPETSDQFLSANKNEIRNELMKNEEVYHFNQNTNFAETTTINDKFSQEVFSLLNFSDSDLISISSSESDLSSLLEDLSEDEYEQLFNDIDI